ncbi:MAG: hypothetical protein FWD89_05320 [Firmicutes bacterium]|nr:hypothetical protein [Bacillota bacterium]
MSTIEKNIPISYSRKIKKETTFKTPRKQGWWVPLLLPHVANLLKAGVKCEVTRINMEHFQKKENRKQPFLFLFTHMQFLDFPVFLKESLPRKSNSASAIDTFRGVYGMLHALGRSVPVRKFKNNAELVRTISHILKKHKAVFNLAPEAQYSLDGFTLPIPDSIGKVIKHLKEPVVTINMHGHYVIGPVWGDGKLRKEFPSMPVVTYAFTPEEIEKMTPEEITTKVKELLDYNEWKTWRESGIKITYQNRAAGLEHILYKCPTCKEEYTTASSGINVWCQKCESKWELTENGLLEGVGHKTTFNTPDEWLLWEKAEVAKEIKTGTYIIEDTVRGISLPNRKQPVEVGNMAIKHTKEGMSIDGHYNNKDFKFHFPPLYCHTLQVTLNSPDFKGKPAYTGFSLDDDSIFFVPSKKGMVYKLFLAWKEFYRLNKLAIAK